jgi:hypothetical protein
MVRVTSLLPLAAEDTEPAAGVKDALMERIGREPRSIAPKQQQAWARSRPWLAGAIAAGVALLVLGGIGGFATGRLSDDGGGASTSAAQARLLQGAAQGTLSVARGESGAVKASFVRAPGQSEGFAYVEGLPPLPAGKAYQAWFTRDMQQFEPSAVFETANGGVWLPAAGPLDDYTAMAFTIEDEAGAKAPTSAPFVVMDLKKSVRAYWPVASGH